MIEGINRAVYRPAWLVKPTHACNFSCKYCYDTDMRKKYGDGVMTMEVWERIVKLASTYGAEIIFHGGEPLYVGIDWYREAFKVAEKYPKLRYGMQSNGSLLNEEFIKLFKDNHLVMGVSYDFTAQSEYRGLDVLENLQLAKELDFKVGCICVVTKKNISRLSEIFEQAADVCGRGSIAFNALFYSASAGSNNVELLTVQDLKRGFGDFFRYYKNRPNKNFREREAETFRGFVQGDVSRQCLYCDCRLRWLGVSPNGDVWPCDRNYGDIYKYGTVFDFDVITDVLFTSAFARFYYDNLERFNNFCSKCAYVTICNGGCNGRHDSVGTLKVVDNSACNYVHTMFSIAMEVFS